MAIGDPWDTSWNPRTPSLRNKTSGAESWRPDEYLETPQTDPLTLKERRRGRMCAEGCGCIEMYDESISGAVTKLPPELAVTIIRDENGRYSARSGIAGGEGETFFLKYAKGRYLGSKCCEGFDGCDPCSVTTSSQNTQVECHRANNRFESLNSSGQQGDSFPKRGGYNYNKALKGSSNWPRRALDTFLKAIGYNTSVQSSSGTDMYVVDEATGDEIVETKKTQYSENEDDARFNVKSKFAPRYITSDNFITDREAFTAGDASHFSCIEDGAIPLRKKPYCRAADPDISGRPVEVLPVCSDGNHQVNFLDNSQEIKGKKNACITSGNDWLYDDRDSCELNGACEEPIAPNEAGIVNTRTRRPVEDSNGKLVTDKETCESTYKDGAPKCLKSDGKEDTSATTKEECEANENNWMVNIFFSNEFVTWEYDKQSCCGKHLLDFNHPAHTPQVSSASAVDEARKGSVCITPYSEVVLLPSYVASNVAAGSTASFHMAMATSTQSDRTDFMSMKAPYWTMVIRPCTFYSSCDVNRGMYDMYGSGGTGQSAGNYYETRAGEEIILYLPMDQFLNSSNFNLTLAPENAIRSGWDEVYRNWTPNMGNVMGNPTYNELAKGGAGNLIGGFPTKFPGDTINEKPFSNWCDYPDSNYDGTGDYGYCEQYLFYEAGRPHNQTVNAKGAINFYAHNIQPQPFKATEEKQNRAKDLVNAGYEKVAWQECVDVSLGHKNGGGPWFFDYGPDYFMYFDLLSSATNKSSSTCKSISDAALAYVDNNVGFLSNDDCGIGTSPSIYVGWKPVDPDTTPKHKCIGLQPIPEELADIVFGTQKGTCTLTRAGTGVQIQLPANGYMSEEECETESKKEDANGDRVYEDDPSWSVSYVGGYKVRESSIIKVRAAGPLNSGQKNYSTIDRMPPMENQVDYLNSMGNDGTSLDYWRKTGLYPRAEVASHISDGCLGMQQHRRIEYASNTKPVKITSRNHKLIDGDLINSYGVLGNFAANVLSTGELQEIQWEDKIGSKCSGDNCDSQTHPMAICAYTSKCTDSNGNELKGKTTAFDCKSGGCDKKDSAGDTCNSQKLCEAPDKRFTGSDSTGRCPSGYHPVPKMPPSHPKGCEIDDLDKSGCGGKWTDGSVNTFKQSCEHLACYGTVIQGKDPDPAPFFVVQNATIDTFDLYTCDGKPLDGTVTNKINIDTDGCGDEEPQACAKTPGLPYESEVKEVFKSVQTDKSLGHSIPFIGDFKKRCIDNSVDQTTVTQGANVQSRRLSDDAIITDAPIDEYHTCGGTTNVCTQSDCKNPNSWVDKINFEDNKATEPKEGISQCENFGQCTIVDGWETNDHAQMTLTDCITMAKRFVKHNPNSPLDHDKDQIYVERCQDTDGNLSNKLSIIGSDNVKKSCEDNFGSCRGVDGSVPHICDKFHCSIDSSIGSEAMCQAMGGLWIPYPTQGACETNGGNWVPKFTSRNACEAQGNRWLVGTYIKRYNDCVIQDNDGNIVGSEEEAFAPCFVRNKLVDESQLRGGGSTVPVYVACPWTGQWDLYNNHEDVGVLVGYSSHIPTVEFNSFFREGFSGHGFRWETRANDYYVQIEQKGICPVCCDHFLPKRLVATVSEQSSQINNWFCGIDLCDAPNADDSKTFRDWMNTSSPKFGGHCCNDIYHPCDLSDLGKCQSNFKNYGTCKTSTGSTEIGVNTRDACLNKAQGNTFTELNSADECETFIRTKPGHFGRPNCRRCSDVYSDQHQIPMKSDPCCPNCKCIVAANDRRVGTPRHPYPDCRTAVQYAKDNGITCNETSDVGNKFTLGKLKAECKLSTQGGSGVENVRWAFDPCACFPNQVGFDCEKEALVTEKYDGSCYWFPGQAGSKPCPGKGATGYCYENPTPGGCGVQLMTSATVATDCYDYPNASQPVYSTCKGLGSIDVPLDYDGTVWRSEWTPMGSVGQHQCKMVNHMFTWPSHCTEGTDFGGGKGITKVSPSSTRAAIFADCDGCDMAQNTLLGVETGRGFNKDGDLTSVNYRAPKQPGYNDSFFMRFVVGCGSSVPSMSAYFGGDVVLQGGFGPGGDQTYRENGMEIWCQITNCSFRSTGRYDADAMSPTATDVGGRPPCFSGCADFESILTRTESDPRGFGTQASPNAVARKYNFAGGGCLSSSNCGPGGPCARTSCCTYNGPDMPLFPGVGLWNGAVACSTGGDLGSKCMQISGTDDLVPKKPSEVFTVHYVKDVDPVTGEGTLVVETLPTFSGRRCGYPKGTPVGIGLAELADAEVFTRFDSIRNKMSRNPSVPAGGTVITHDIPEGDGRPTTPFWELRVADVSKLTTRNPRKDRHLRLFDRARVDSNGNTVRASDFSDMNMLQPKDLPSPMGLNPWPVDHQTNSELSSRDRMWPKGHVSSDGLRVIQLESLRADPTGSARGGGRIGPLPTANNLNRMFEFNEVKQGDTTTPIPKILPPEPVMINSIENIYSGGSCTDGVSSRGSCGGGHIWIPKFKYTKVTTEYDHDLADAEKVVISGSIAYPATCMGARMGLCLDSTTGQPNGDNINNCELGECKDLELGTSSPYILDEDGNKIVRKTLCDAGSAKKKKDYLQAGKAVPEDLVFVAKGQWNQLYNDSGNVNDEDCDGDETLCAAFGGQWVVGLRNDEKDNKGAYKDPLNDNPQTLDPNGTESQYFFAEGCPVGCQTNGFYLKDACSPPSDDNPKGGCLECFNFTTKDAKSGVESEITKCPRAPFDGSYVARTRGCQNAAYQDQASCEGAGYLWWGKISNSKKEFALHSEMEIPIHDASKLWSNLNKPSVASGRQSDWEYDLSLADNRVMTNPLSGSTKSLQQEVEAAASGLTDPVEKEEARAAACNQFRSGYYVQVIENGVPVAGHCANISRINDSMEDIDALPWVSFGDKEAALEKLASVAFNVAIENDGTLRSLSKEEDKTNLVTQRQKISNLSSPEAMAMGHAVGIGPSPRRYKGVIYGPSVTTSHIVGTRSVEDDQGNTKNFKDDIKNFIKLQDPPYRGYWSRHGGSFDIIIGYPYPENNCRQGNSNKPTNMDFYMRMDQQCCNHRGPTTVWACPDKCYGHSYMGPIVTHPDLDFGDGNSTTIHVNIHE